MQKLYNKDTEHFIIYNAHKSNKKIAPCVIFIHGYMSDMSGAKALHAEEHCRLKGYNFIRYDQYGCGKSSGNFLQQTMSSWLEGLELVIDQLASGPVILVGSSVGAWLALLASIKHPDKVSACVCMAAAVDCSQLLMWNRLSFEQQQMMIENGVINIPGADCAAGLPVSYDFILDGKKYLILNQNTIPLTQPLHLIHGMLDNEVPYEISVRTLEKVDSAKVTLKLIKDGTHRLSRPEDLQMIAHSIDEVWEASLLELEPVI